MAGATLYQFQRSLAFIIKRCAGMLVLVIFCSSPFGVSSGRIPTIPAGHRAQYYVLRPDGGYSSGYDTGLGQTEITEANGINEVRGAYAGGPLRVRYTAGVNGYVPTVEVRESEPVPQPQLPLPPLPPLPPSPPQPQTTSVESADARVTHNSDGSYAFSYITSDHSRHEIADARNNVRGSFSFVAPDDVRRTVNYKAGAATGFVAEGAHLPSQASDTGTDTVPETTASDVDETEATTSTGTDDSAVDNTTPLSDTTVKGGPGTGGSYSFGYRTPDQERVESGDAAGNVQGQFSFVAPDGVRRRVDYDAGANKGFVARGDHLPTPPTDLTVDVPSQTFRVAGVPRTSVPRPVQQVPPGTVYSWSTPGSWPNAVPGSWPITATGSWPNAVPGSWPITATGSWPNTVPGSWPITVPDPLRIDAKLTDLVVRNYLPHHPRKTGYVLDME